MSDSKASVTALISAFTRAHHSRHDVPPLFDDFLAEKLLAPEELALLERNLAESLAFFDPEAAAARPEPRAALARALRAMGGAITLSRARYTEDLLASTHPQGITQYVILGAGFDTFAFRKPELARSLRVFELDHPATQADKLRRCSAAGWALPEHLCFVPIDFARDDLRAVLARAGFDSQSPAFFSWLGVTYYLPRAVVLHTLEALASVAARGSTVVFDHLDAEAFIPAKAGTRVQRMRAAVQRAGEPMQTGFEPGSLELALRERGLVLREQLDPAAIQARYFEGRRDGYSAFEHIHFAAAVVA